ncbi:MAG: hypothetical protein QNI84_09065 [Henriciella sp.]|nr:hypothetical protein [Henriciella sp.]
MTSRSQITYAPRDNFRKRKLFVWALVGPFNPAFWLMALGYQIMGEVGYWVIWLLIAPTCLSAGLALRQLKPTSAQAGKLTGPVLGWSLATIILYPLLVMLLVLTYQFLSTLILKPESLVSLLLDIDAFIVIIGFILLYAPLIGILPALFSALTVQLMIKPLLFEAVHPPRRHGKLTAKTTAPQSHFPP